MKLIGLITIVLAASSLTGCGVGQNTSAAAALPAASPIITDEEAVKITIRSLEERIRRDPEDFISYNKLAGYYLQFHRETGDGQYLDLAQRAAKSSLAALPAEMNAGALAALAQVEFASHDFISARDHAQQLARMEPSKSYSYILLFDSLIELGEYDEAALAVNRVKQLEGNSVNSESRLARFALLKGQTDAATRKISDAVAFALNSASPQRENVAWLRWQLGEITFSTGNYPSAERHYRDALVTFPGYYRAAGALGKTLAARGDIAGAISEYERVVAKTPDPVFIAALGDLYKLAGREKEAASQYALVEQIARLGKSAGALYDRQLAIFYADHDMKADDAYALAKKEYETRRDIYGADVLAWAALKAGKIDEAQSAIKEALRLGTRDAKLFYHAGMIYRAAGDNSKAKDYLERALKLSPRFDPLQATVARRALEEL
ncbi:MAG: tetratricopeptide repeat protein [Acidobacteriota bacterium]